METPEQTFSDSSYLYVGFREAGLALLESFIRVSAPADSLKNRQELSSLLFDRL
jgi:hypothetical protein